MEKAKKKVACPYHAMVHLSSKPSVRVVFLPYAYLIDPVLREKMAIKLDSSVIVLDEAHNIASVSNSALSLSFNYDSLLGSIAFLDSLEWEVLDYGDLELHIWQFLIGLLTSLSEWMFEKRTDEIQCIPLQEVVNELVSNFRFPNLDLCEKKLEVTFNLSILWQLPSFIATLVFILQVSFL